MRFHLSLRASILCLSAVLATANTASASVFLQFGITPVRATGFSDRNGSAGVNGMRWGIIVDTQGNGFNAGSYDGGFNIDTSGFLTINGGTVTDDYYVAHPSQLLTSTATATGSDPGGAGAITSISAVPFGGTTNISEGDPFAIIWFETNTDASSRYGVQANATATGTFVIPADTITQSYTDFFASPTADPIKPASHTLGAGALTPEITVSQPENTGLTDGSNTPIGFGAIPKNTTTTRVFTIRNTGNGELTGISATIDGTDASSFNVSAAPAASIPATTGVTTLTVQFAPTTAGTKSATLHIASNDADENPFDVKLTGISNGTPGTLAINHPPGFIINVAEEAGTVSIPIIRSGGTDGNVSVVMNTVNGTAMAASDFTALTNANVQLGDGVSTLNFPITILNPAGTGTELNETFTVNIAAGPNVTVGGTTQVTVRIIDSMDTTLPPAPTITTPALNASLNVPTGGTIDISGSATDNKGVKGVEVMINNSGTWVPAVVATPNAASTNWTLNGVIIPATGANTLSVRAIDTRDNVTNPAATRPFKVLRPLMVTVNGSGTVTAGFSTTAANYREVDKSITITGTNTTTPAPGSIFTGWTVTWAGNTPTPPAVPTNLEESAARIAAPLSAMAKQTLTFIFREGMTLTANFAPNPFWSLAGTYNGLVETESANPDVSANSTEGFFNATVQNTGAFTGKLTIDGFVLNMAGTFDEQGVARFGTARATTVVVPRTGKPSLVVGFTASTTSPFKITGTVTQTGFKRSDVLATSNIEADRAFYGAQVLTGGITASQAIVNLASTNGRTPGEFVTGAGVPATTKIHSITSNTQITLDKNATTTNAAASLTFTRDVPADYMASAVATTGTYTAIFPPKPTFYSVAGSFNGTTDFFDPGSANDFQDGDLIKLRSNGTLPPELNENDTYTVVGKTGNTFQIGNLSMVAIGFSDGSGEAIDASSQTEGLAKSDYPQGYGVGTVTITKTGTLTVAGTLADGTALSASSTLSQPNPFIEVAVYASLYTSKGFISGTVALNSNNPQSDLSASGMKWMRPLQSTIHYYPSGWPEVITVDLLAAKYAAVANQSAMKAPDGSDGGDLGDNLQLPDADGNVTLTFTDGQLTETLSKAANLSIADLVVKVPDNDPTFTMAVNRTSGAVTGTVTHTDDTIPSFNAILYQKGTIAGAYGYFLTKQPAVIDFTGESGGVTVIGQP